MDYSSARPFTILVSSAGRRVSLARTFRQTIAELGIPGRVIAADLSDLAPAMHYADARFIVPRCTDPSFDSTVLQLCDREHVDLVVPTIDTELPIWARLRAQLRAAGTTVAVSNAQTIEIASDKQKTNRHCADAGIPVPRQSAVLPVLADRRGWHLPLVVKPARGSASVGLQIVETWADLEQIAIANTDDLVVEQCLSGVEYTVDLYVDRRGRVHCPVVRQRLEVRAGEVSKSQVIRDDELSSLAAKVVETLPGAYGVLNVQMFSDGSNVGVIEINARYGGGYPLTDKAGGTYSKWLVQEVATGANPPFDPDIRHGLTMLRWDEEIFVNG